MIIITFYGIITELLQHVMKLGRSIEIGDLLADIFGGALGYLISGII